jgi:glutamate dehydrogenase (NAD(P)+)
MLVTREALRHLGMNPASCTAAVQGAGNVGLVSAMQLATLGVKVVAISDMYGGLHNPKGLDLQAVKAHLQQHKRLDGFEGASRISNAEILELPVDILVPAALENQITERNAGRITARIIAEGANGPTTPDADNYLCDKGVFLIPDILANAGGVTTSYFEWVQDRYGYFWEEHEVNERLERKMVEAFNSVLETKLKYNCDMRTAAYVVAISRVAVVTKLRGMYA